MAINVSALSEYVNQNSGELLTKAVLGANTLNYIDIMPGVKYKDVLNYLDSTVVFGDASICGWDPKGGDTFTQRTIEVAPIKINKEFCDKDLRKYWMNYQMLFEAGRETLPFEEKFIENNLAAINAELEKQIWQSDKTKGGLFNGLIPTMVAEATVIKKELEAGYNAVAVIDAAYEAMTPTMLIQEPAIFVSHSTFRAYVQGLNATCCANREVIDAAAEKIAYPGDSRVSIVPVTGMEGVNEGIALAIATPAKNLVYGTDVEGSENTFKFWYDDKEDKFLFKVLFNAGTQVKFPNQIVRVYQKA
jgi:hypothetical protein